jgi:hypothetical protein
MGVVRVPRGCQSVGQSLGLGPFSFLNRFPAAVQAVVGPRRAVAKNADGRGARDQQQDEEIPLPAEQTGQATNEPTGVV